MDFFQSIDWMQLLRCFVVGGLICIIGQILIDKTKLTSARILVIFVTTGVVPPYPADGGGEHPPHSGGRVQGHRPGLEDGRGPGRKTPG